MLIVVHLVDLLRALAPLTRADHFRLGNIVRTLMRISHALSNAACEVSRYACLGGQRRGFRRPKRWLHGIKKNSDAICVFVFFRSNYGVLVQSDVRNALGHLGCRSRASRVMGCCGGTGGILGPRWWRHHFQVFSSCHHPCNSTSSIRCAWCMFLCALFRRPNGSFWGPSREVRGVPAGRRGGAWVHPTPYHAGYKIYDGANNGLSWCDINVSIYVYPVAYEVLEGVHMGHFGVHQAARQGHDCVYIEPYRGNVTGILRSHIQAISMRHS